MFANSVLALHMFPVRARRTSVEADCQHYRCRENASTSSFHRRSPASESVLHAVLDEVTAVRAVELGRGGILLLSGAEDPRVWRRDVVAHRKHVSLERVVQLLIQ